MALISKSFPRSTRPSLQTSRHQPAPAGKSLKAPAKAALTRPSLQTSPPPAGDRVAAGAPLGDCSRSIQDACADTRASSRDGLAPTRAAPAPGSRGSRHRSAACPAASIAVARADSPQHCSTIDAGLVDAAGMPRRSPHTAASPWMPSPPRGTERSASGAGRLQPSTARAIPGPAALIGLTTTAPSPAGSNQTCRCRPRGWVHSREHTRVNSRERQGDLAPLGIVGAVGDCRGLIISEICRHGSLRQIFLRPIIVPEWDQRTSHSRKRASSPAR